MIAIGFAGTAKNTGKTTAALAVLEQAQRAGLHLGLTSIGYDGEAVDHITGLPKPRYLAPAGTLVTTARDVLNNGTAQLQLLETLDSSTLFGPVVLAKVEQPGSLVLVGPNHKAGLRSALRRLEDLGVDLAVVDGALNRLAPMAVCNGLVLSTGAAYDQRIAVIADHAHALNRLLRLPVLPPATQRLEESYILTFPGGKIKTLPGTSLLTKEAAQDLCRLISTPLNSLEIPGVCAPDAVLNLIECGLPQLAGGQLIFDSALNLAASKDTRTWLKVFNRSVSLGIKIYVRESLPLRCITVNPIFPEFTTRSGQYHYGHVDADKLIEVVTTRLSDIPVVNVMDKPQPDLLGWLEIPVKGKKS